MKVSFRPAAASDLDEIRAYIGQDSPFRALTFVGKLISRAEALADRPRVGRRRPELDDENENLLEVRSVAFRSYVIIYHVDGERVKVLRIVHGARDIRRLRIAP